MRILDRLVRLISILIAVVAGSLVILMVPYFSSIGKVARTRSVETVAPAETEAPEETPAPEAKVPAPPADGEEGAAESLSAQALSATPAPYRVVPVDPKLPEDLKPPEGLVLSPKSTERRDLALSSLVYPDGGMPIPPLYQRDYKTPVANLKGRDISVWTSGCGAAVVSMVVSYMTGASDQTPYTLFRWAVEKGLYKGSGLDHSALTWMAEMYGISSRWIGPDADEILSALASGNPVIVHIGKGVFSDNGHYIVLRGIAPSGEIYVNDPASSERSAQTFPLEQIIAESKSDTPFMICSRAGAKA